MKRSKTTAKSKTVGTKPALDPVTEATHQLARPVYEDALQPAAIEVGKSLQTVGQVINTFLIPVKGVVWGSEKIVEYLKVHLPEKLKDLPADQLQPPGLMIAGPTIEAMRFYGEQELMKDMFANLLASSIDKAKSALAHPGFVEIIKNMSPDEAKIMTYMKSNRRIPMLEVKGRLEGDEAGKWVSLARNFTQVGEFAACDNPELSSNYIDNLVRLGLVEVPGATFIAHDNAYDSVEADLGLEILKQKAENENLRFEVERKQVRLTDLGVQFSKVCIT